MVPMSVLEAPWAYLWGSTDW